MDLLIFGKILFFLTSAHKWCSVDMHAHRPWHTYIYLCLCIHDNVCVCVCYLFVSMCGWYFGVCVICGVRMLVPCANVCGLFFTMNNFKLKPWWEVWLTWFLSLACVTYLVVRKCCLSTSTSQDRNEVFSHYYSFSQFWFHRNQMATNNIKQFEDSLDCAISQLNAADYCNHAAGLVTFKNEYSMSTGVSQINNKLRTLSTVFPLITDSIKIRDNNYSPKNSNASYAKSRFQAISGNKTSEMHLQSFIDHASSKKSKQSTPNCASTRKRKWTKITQDEQLFSSKKAPTSHNNQKFLVKEALTAFDTYKVKSKNE